MNNHIPSSREKGFTTYEGQLAHGLSLFKAPFYFAPPRPQLGVPGEGGLRRQGIGRARHPHQEPPHQVRRPRLLAHPEEHRAEDADEGHLAAASGSDPHRQPQALVDLQMKQKERPEDGVLMLPLFYLQVIIEHLKLVALIRQTHLEICFRTIELLICP